MEATKATDSTVCVTYSLEVRIELTMPEDRLVPFLKGEIDLEPCLKLDEIEMENLPDGFDVHIIDPSIYQPMEVNDIHAGEDGLTQYIFDGTNLVEI